MSGPMKVPDYIRQMFQPPQPENGLGERALWEIPITRVWVPFLAATNLTQATQLPWETLGAPLRLARTKEGAPRFTPGGQPIMVVAPQLAAQVTIVRENFVAALASFTRSVRKANPEYQALVEAAVAAGLPILKKDAQDMATRCQQ